MGHIEFPSTDYSSEDENNTNIHIAQNGDTSETSSSPTVQTHVTYPTTFTQLFTFDPRAKSGPRGEFTRALSLASIL